MCLIISKPAGVALSRELAHQSVLDNKDGWGIVWVGPDKVMHSYKGMLEKEYLEMIDRIPLEAAAIIHTRIGTSGKKDVSNCHPFILSHSIAMAHNGIIRIERPQQDYSDTWHFAWHVASPMLRRHPDLYGTDEIKTLFARAIGMGSKLAFLRDDGTIMLVNEKQGQWYEGLWVSNGKSLWGQAWSKEHNLAHNKAQQANYTSYAHDNHHGYPNHEWGGHYTQRYGAGFIHTGPAPKPRWSVLQAKMVWPSEVGYEAIEEDFEQVSHSQGMHTLQNGQVVGKPWPVNQHVNHQQHRTFTSDTSGQTRIHAVPSAPAQEVQLSEGDILTAEEASFLLMAGMA